MNFITKIKLNLDSLENFEKLDWFNSEEFWISYCDLSCFYFYLESRILFSQKELRLMNKKNKNDICLNSSFRKKFFIFSFFQNSSFLAFLELKSELVLENFWNTEETVLITKKLKDLKQLKENFKEEIENLSPNLHSDFRFDYESKLEKQINKTFTEYLEFLNFYFRLLKIRTHLVNRLRKYKFRPFFLKNILLRIDVSLMSYFSSLKQLAFSLLFWSLSLELKGKIPNYVKNFEIERKNAGGPLFDKNFVEVLSNLVNSLPTSNKDLLETLKKISEINDESK